MSSLSFTDSEMKDMFDYLEGVRDTGSINMFGAAPYLQNEFGITIREARDVLKAWMGSYGLGKY